MTPKGNSDIATLAKRKEMGEQKGRFLHSYELSSVTIEASLCPGSFCGLVCCAPHQGQGPTKFPETGRESAHVSRSERERELDQDTSQAPHSCLTCALRLCVALLSSECPQPDYLFFLGPALSSQNEESPNRPSPEPALVRWERSAPPCW